MRLHHYLSIATSVAVVAAQGQCRFPNGTLLPDTDEWNIYQPCPGADGPTAICCALARRNPPWGNILQGYTQDECLPNGLCQNRLTMEDGERVTTFFVDYCTENGLDTAKGKCLNLCPSASQELTTKITPCDGTANSSRWCCGDKTACCKSNTAVIMLDQILGQVSSSTTIQSSTTTSAPASSSTSGSASVSGSASSPSAASGSTNSADTNNEPSSKGLSGGAIAGVVIGAIAGLALIAAVLFFARRAAQRKKAEQVAYTSTPVAEAPYNPAPASQELGSSTKYAHHVQEMPEAPPSELHGDTPHRP